MPSPIAHVSVGYLLYRAAAPRLPKLRGFLKPWHSLVWCGLFVGFSMAPDVDSVVGILTGDMGRYHNQWTHSILFCLLLSLAAAVVLRVLLRAPFRVCLLLTLSCCSLHVLMDAFAYGRGVKALWPLTERRFQSPVPIFVGLHWSQGLWSPLHLLTVVNELVVVGLLAAVPRVVKRRRTRVSASGEAGDDRQT